MRTFGKVLITLLSLGVAGYAVVAYGILPLGSLVHPDMKAVYFAHQAGIYTHIFAAATALALGPFQFWTRLRQKHRKLHRWIGRLYLGIGVLLGGLSGLYMAQFAFGGLAAKTGFALLALAWIHTGARAFAAIKAGNVENHKNWMVRNFALTLAAVTLRLYLPVSLVSGAPFEVAYPVIAWLCWVPNLLVAEWLIATQKNRAGAEGSAFAG